MYLVDFFQRMMRRSNIPVIIYLVLNVCIIAFTVTAMLASTMPAWAGFLVGIVVYILSLAIALSPIGEAILRFQTGCKIIKRQDQLDFLMPLFQEDYATAKRKDASISDQVQLYINDDAAPNAFATGRKTICVTEGLLQMPPEQIKATLAHEFGHLAHKDTDLILLVSVGNMIVSGIIVCIRVAIELMHLIFCIMMIFVGGEEGAIGILLSSLYRLMVTATVSGLTWLWTKLGVLLVMKSSRDNEYEADEFAFQLGYGQQLILMLHALGGNAQNTGLFANLASSHPATSDRIARIQSLQNANIMTYTAPAPTPATAASINLKQPVSIYVPDSDDNAHPASPIPAAAMVDRQKKTRTILTQTEVNGAEQPESHSFKPIYCIHCGKKLEVDSNFCMFCGARVEN